MTSVDPVVGHHYAVGPSDSDMKSLVAASRRFGHIRHLESQINRIDVR
jgi:hypothetical protein